MSIVLKTCRLGIAVMIGLWTGSAQAQLDMSKAVQPWQFQPGLSVAELRW